MGANAVVPAAGDAGRKRSYRELAIAWKEAKYKSFEATMKQATLIVSAKESLPEYEFKKFLSDVTHLSDGTVSKFRAIAQCAHFKNPNHWETYPFAWTVLYELTL